jgi:excinuclease ABC subunit A
MPTLPHGDDDQDTPPAPDAGRITARGVRVHNLKNIDVVLPRRRLIVITGPSGSGKSSLAFDTLYAEGQRRYLESLSSFAHQFLDQLPKPDVDRIEGLSPALAIDQKGLGASPRSTVGTITEISNFLRLLYARCGTVVCPDCGVEAASRPLAEIRDAILALPAGTRFWLLAPVVRGRKGAHKKLLDDLRRQGHLRALIDGEMHELEAVPALAATQRHDIEVVVDGMTVRDGLEARLGASLDRAAALGDGTVTVQREGGTRELYSRRSSCPGCSRAFPELDWRLFSFNSPRGSCPECHGLGALRTVRGDALVPDPALPLAGGAVAFLKGKESGWLYTQIEALAGALGFGLDTPWRDLPAEARQVVLHGLTPALDKRLQSHLHYQAFLQGWTGLVTELVRRHRETKSDRVRGTIEKLMAEETCPACHGHRLRPDALAVRVGGLHIGEAGALPVSGLLAWARGLEFPPGPRRAVAGPVLEQVTSRAQFLAQVGLDYLSLDRGASTLSGGEGQRVRLATQVGSRLTGVLYILDEPSIGLHHRDIRRLIATLRALRDRGNTVVVVEHDRDIMLAADHVLDLGPGAGEHGGRIVAQGTWREVAATPGSLTGAYLAGDDRPRLAMPLCAGAPPAGRLTMRGLTGRNLQGIDLEIPLGQLTVVTGVSGSGKSTAVHDTLYLELARRLHRAGTRAEPFASLEGEDQLRSVVLVDQSPIGRTPRSTPATYTGLFSPVRTLLAATELARMRGWGAGHFSFNTSGGRCPVCEGAGVRRLTMDFLPDVEVACEECGGARYGRETLEVRYKGLNVAELLALPVEAARVLLEPVPACRAILEVLDGVGLGYLRLGQPGATLSGGEAQRLKLARELSRGGQGRTLYILDEPTTGLHVCDVDRLLEVLARLVGRGHTVVVIEHHPEIIRRADRVIDIGPEGGGGGGRIVAQGSLADLLAAPASYTGAMLREFLGTP